MISLHSMPTFAGKISSPVSIAQCQPETPQAKAALTQDISFSGHGDKFEKKSEKKQTKLVLHPQGLSFEPKAKSNANAFLHKQLDELIAKDADLDQPTTRFGKPILHEAAIVGDNELALKALRHGARVRTGDNQNFTALHLAARGGHEQVVETLLEAGADPSRVDIYGNKPSHGAEAAGHPDIAEQITWYKLAKFLSENDGPLGF